MIATDERTYALRRCDGTLIVDADRLVVQGEPHADGRVRMPVTIERADVVALHLGRGWFGSKLSWENAAGYRNLLIRVRHPGALTTDLQAHHWPLA